MATKRESGTAGAVWLQPDRPRRAPLDRERIVAAAIRLADADGMHTLSMRSVATELGVGTMSLYHHVPGKNELIDLMVDTALGTARWPEHPSGDWRADLRQIAMEARALFLRHPWALNLRVSGPLLGPNLLRLTDVTLAVLDPFGLPSAQLNALVGAVNAYVTGAVRNELAVTETIRSSGMTQDEWQATAAPYIERVAASGEYPMFTRHVLDGEHLSAEEAFFFGFDRLLDGVADHIDRAR
jgi:AcrR family transcriptional regulator